MATKSPSPMKSPARSPEVAAQAEHNLEADIVAHQAENEIEPSDHDDESDAGYFSDSASGASTSISSSVRDYNFENGRRYHKFREGAYLFPNDEPEQDREDMKHAMVVNLCGGRLHYAPLNNPQNIIDLGTGTGIWAIDSTFALSHLIKVLHELTNI
jgi:hypothetical protein